MPSSSDEPSSSTMSLRRCNSDPMLASAEFKKESETDPMIEMEEQQKKKSEDPPEKQKPMDSSGSMSSSTVFSSATARTANMSTSTIFKSTQHSDDGSSPEDDDDDPPPPEQKRRRCGGFGTGIVEDWKRTIGTHWKGEMTNLSLTTIAVGFFLFFACIAPAITFGAIYAKATHNWIGAVEMIAATAWCGIVYALIGGQPMMINGGTGPVLAFTEILFKMSEGLDVPFLTFNAWIGIWVCIYMIIAAFTHLNCIIQYATRFTDEIFSLLISTIFIINALGNPFAPIGMYYYFDPNHSSHQRYEDDPNYNYLTTALFSLLIFLGQVYLSFQLRKVKFSPFLYHQFARNIVTDFAVVVSIVIWTVVAGVSGIPTETLLVPSTFAPTYACCDETCDTNWPQDCPEQEQAYGSRPWLVDLGDLNGKAWVALMAAGPALLAFVLVFLDDGITWHLINHKAHKLTHGAAYNYDTLIIGIMIFINSLLGFPWLVAATVRSLNHVHALAEKTPDGKIVSVKETRLTGLLIHLLCLASIFALNVLTLIPMPVLYGVFFFMGVVSLGTNQFWGRITMFFMQPSKYPLEPYTVHVRPRRMHLFTMIQLGLFVLLYVVKAIKAIAIAFPLVIALCIPIRAYLLPRIFTKQELIMIDSDEDTIKAWLDEQAEEMTEALLKEEPEGEPELPKDEHEDEGEPQEEEEEEEEPEVEERDQVTPLDEVGMQMATRRKRRDRTKTVSCPPGMLFVGEGQEEQRDQVPPLGQTVPRRRRTRKKTLSCPTPHMLFAEVPLDATNVGISILETHHEVDEEDESKAEEASSISSTDQGVRPRRRRTKSLSCPPHMLFKEAERHVAENYFFG